MDSNFCYCSGPYGERRLRSFTKDLDWKSEWDEISEKDKSILLEWLNTDDIINKKLYEISLLTSRDNPLVKYLVKEKKIDEPDVEGYIERSKELDDDSVVTTTYAKAKEFVEAFLSCKAKHNIRKVFDGRKLQIGFVVDKLSETEPETRHMIRFASLSYIWKPSQENDLEQEQKSAMMKSPQKSDVYLGKILQTTREHPWGDEWAGILELNSSKLSTIIGGSRHAVAMPRRRYRILWINLKTRAQKEIICESADISAMIDAKQIFETDGYEKAPAIYPRNSYPEYGTNQCLRPDREKHAEAIRPQA